MGTVEKTRYEHIDYAKGLGVLMIMFAHVVQNFPVMTPANLFVRAFHVPIFFVAAGYLFACRNFAKMADGNSSFDFILFLKKRVKTLLVPYVIFSLFNSLLKFAVLYLTHSITNEVVHKELIELCITGNGTVWFLLTLFLTEIIFNLVYIKFNTNIKSFNNIITIICVASLFLPYVILDAKSPIMIVAIRVIAALGYYCIGYLFGYRKLYNNKTDEIKSAILVFFTGVALWIILGADIDFFNGHFANPCGSIVSSILLSYGAILMLACFEKNAGSAFFRKTFDFYGKNSLVITLVHPTVLLVVMYPLGTFLTSFTGGNAIVVSILLFLFLSLIQIPCAMFINKFLPFVLGK